MLHSPTRSFRGVLNEVCEVCEYFDVDDEDRPA